ncbi:MAG: hypothetical protein QME66_05130 [Candidatus Eisenbacteria bacterium]|nr:hypothetical protein [Candidatus Eisenbacteria bacterium]
MNHLRSSVLLAGVLALLVSPLPVRAQEAKVILGKAESPLSYRLPHDFIFLGSEKVYVHDSLLVRGRDYSVDYSAGMLHLARPVPGEDSLLVTYAHLPFYLGREYRSETQLTSAQDSADQPHRKKESLRENKSDELSSFSISGSKVISLEAGSSKDFSLKQALDLRVGGRVNDVEIAAVLSDRDSPAGGNGLTEELGELDKILVEVRSRSSSVLLGDYDASRDESGFGDFSRQLQGVRIATQVNSSSLNLSLGSSRSEFLSKEIFGVDGKQGPYYLISSSEGSLRPGSEKVFLDGERMTRGEGADYSVDYYRGAITFQPRRIIGKDSRILVDFQLQRDGGKKGFVGTVLEHGEKGGKHFSAAFVQETEHPLTPASSLEKGTLPGAQADSVSDPPAAGQSALSRSLLQLGAELPVTNSAVFNFEGAVSRKGTRGVNRYDSYDGFAFRTGSHLKKEIGVGTMNMGELECGLSLKKVEDSFLPFGRVNEGFNEISWNGTKEELSSGGVTSLLKLNYRPVKTRELSFERGGLSGGNDFSSRRNLLSFTSTGNSTFGGRYEGVISSFPGRAPSERTTHGMNTTVGLGKVRPFAFYEREASSGGNRSPRLREEYSSGANVRFGDVASFELRGTKKDEFTKESQTWSGISSRVTGLFSFDSAPTRELKASGNMSHTVYRETAKSRHSLGQLNVGYDKDGMFEGKLRLEGTRNGFLTLRRDLVFVGVGKGNFDVNGNPVPGGDYELSQSRSDDSTVVTSVRMALNTDFSPFRCRDKNTASWLSNIFWRNSIETIRQGSMSVFQIGGYDGVLSGETRVNEEIEFAPGKTGSFAVSFSGREALSCISGENEVEREDKYGFSVGVLRSKARRGDIRYSSSSYRMYLAGASRKNLVSRTERTVGSEFSSALSSRTVARIQSQVGSVQDAGWDSSRRRIQVTPSLVYSDPGKVRIEGRAGYGNYGTSLSDTGGRFSYLLLIESRMGSSTMVSLSLDGKMRKGEPVQHTGRMEVRAFF